MKIELTVELTEKHGFIVVFLSLLMFFIVNAIVYPLHWFQFATNILVGMLLAYVFAWLWRAAMWYYGNEEFSGIGITARRVVMVAIVLICLGGAAHFLLLFVAMITPMFFDLVALDKTLVVLPLIMATLLICVAAYIGLELRITETEKQEQGAI